MFERKMLRFEFETGPSMLQYVYNLIFGYNPVGRLLQRMHSVWKFSSREWSRLRTPWASWIWLWLVVLWVLKRSLWEILERRSWYARQSWLRCQLALRWHCFPKRSRKTASQRIDRNRFIWWHGLSNSVSFHIFWIPLRLSFLNAHSFHSINHSIFPTIKVH